MTGAWVRSKGKRFVDRDGRQLILRGLNLGGDSKLPYPGGGTHYPSSFTDHRSVSFVGRPLPLGEADQHLQRIAGWGFNCLRLVVTWEAVEHAGPRQYDHAYLDYIAQLCERAATFGLAVFIDFHQDVWSRMSGGSGAPGWVFERLGLDFRRFDAAGAAQVMQYRYNYACANDRQEDSYPSMSWALNYQMPVNGILWSAFFAGTLLTPRWQIEGRNVQDDLQSLYLGAMAVMAQQLRAFDNVIGFDSLNEPGLGWLGQKLSQRAVEPPHPRRAGLAWTPLDGLRVAAGIPTAVPCWQTDASRSRITGVEQKLINPQGVSIWLRPGSDPFEQAGAWRRADRDGVALNEEFFCAPQGHALDVERDCMQPFFHKVAETIRAERDDWLLFAEINPYATSLGRGFAPGLPPASVNASHWYDVGLLWSKRFSVADDPPARAELRRRYRAQLRHLRGLGDDLDGGLPTLIGEFGIPYDLDEGQSYALWQAGRRDSAVWAKQTAALELMYEVLDELLLSATQWNYTASNRNSLRIGDGWNQEDLSVYSDDQLTKAGDPYSGARAAQGFCRVYARAVQGSVEEMHYARLAKRFRLTLQADAQIQQPTDIYIPPHLGEPTQLQLEGVAAKWRYEEHSRRLLVWAKASGVLLIELSWIAQP